MTSLPARMVASARRRRQVGLGVLRSLATAVVLVALYYLLPLDRLVGLPLAVILVVGLLVLLAVSAWQLRLVIGARYPAVRAGEGAGHYGAVVPAAVRFGLFRDGPGQPGQLQPPFDPHRFAVLHGHGVQHRGFGDITAVSQSARLVVTAQMILDLLALGLGIRVFIGAVQLARQAHPDPAGPAAPTEQPQQQPG
jgi:voltage-gated potassium channel